MNNITLIDGEEMNQQHPDTFQVPTEAIKEALRPGDAVKIGIETPGSLTGSGSERIWVIIQEAQYPAFSGIIDSLGLLTDDHGLTYGDNLSFEARHILDFNTAEAQEIHEPLKAIEEIIDIDETEEGVDLSVEQFSLVDPVSISSDRPVSLFIFNLISVSFFREDDSLLAIVGLKFDPSGPVTPEAYAQATVCAANALIAEGRSLSEPTVMRKCGEVLACWQMTFPLTMQPGAMLKVVVGTYEAVMSRAKALVQS